MCLLACLACCAMMPALSTANGSAISSSSAIHPPPTFPFRFNSIYSREISCPLPISVAIDTHYHFILALTCNIYNERVSIHIFVIKRVKRHSTIRSLGTFKEDVKGARQQQKTSNGSSSGGGSNNKRTKWNEGIRTVKKGIQCLWQQSRQLKHCRRASTQSIVLAIVQKLYKNGNWPSEQLENKLTN